MKDGSNFHDNVVIVVNGTHICIIDQRYTYLDTPNSKTANEPSSQIRVPGLSLRFIPYLFQACIPIPFLQQNASNGDDNGDGHVERTVKNFDLKTILQKKEYNLSTYIETVVNRDILWKEITFSIVELSSIIQRLQSHGCYYSSHQNSKTCIDPAIISAEIPFGITGTTNSNTGTTNSRQSSEKVSIPSTCTMMNNCLTIRTESSFELLCESMRSGNNRGQKAYILNTRNQKEESFDVLHVQNNHSGFVISDFFGYNNYKQILFLPKILINDDEKKNDVVDMNTKEQSSYPFKKQSLVSYLLRSVLVDGTNLYIHPSKCDVSIDELSVDHISSISIRLNQELTSIVLPQDYSKYDQTLSGVKDVEKLKKRKLSNTISQENKNEFQTVPNGTTINEHISDMHPSQTSKTSSVASSSSSSTTSWKEKIKIGLEERLRHETMQIKREHNIKFMKELIIQQNQRIIQRLALEGLPSSTTATTSCSNSSESNQVKNRQYGRDYILEMVSLRHKVRPLDTISYQDAFGLKMYLEVDIVLNSKKKNNIQLNYDPLLYDVQLSCAPYTTINTASNDKDNMNVKVNTKSGLVPSLHIGQCVTILASVIMSNIQLAKGLSTPLSLVMNLFWNNNNHNISEQIDMKGISLGLIRIPPETLLLKQGALSEEVIAKHFSPSFSKSDDHTYLGREISSEASYDYRKPTMIIIDISNEISSNPHTEWKSKIIDSLDRYLGDGNKIDIQLDNLQKQLHIGIYAESSEHTSNLIELVKKVIPEGTNVLGITKETMTEDSIVQSLQVAIKHEIQLMSKHCTMVERISSTELQDFLYARRKTDEWNSRLLNLRNEKSRFYKKG